MQGKAFMRVDACPRQAHRLKVGSSTQEYYFRTLYARYMGFLDMTLESRFGESSTTYFYIFALHPSQQTK